MPSGGLHVLIIDDVAEDRTWLAHSLRQTLAPPLFFSEAATGGAGIQHYQHATTQPPPDGRCTHTTVTSRARHHFAQSPSARSHLP